MTGKDIIKKIREIGEEKEVKVIAEGACEGVFCHMKRDICDIKANDNIITFFIDVDE